MRWMCPIPLVSGKLRGDLHPLQSGLPSMNAENTLDADSTDIDRSLAKLSTAKESLIAKARRLVA